MIDRILEILPEFSRIPQKIGMSFQKYKHVDFQGWTQLPNFVYLLQKLLYFLLFQKHFKTSNFYFISKIQKKINKNNNFVSWSKNFLFEIIIFYNLQLNFLNGARGNFQGKLMSDRTLTAINIKNVKKKLCLNEYWCVPFVSADFQLNHYILKFMIISLKIITKFVFVTFDLLENSFETFFYCLKTHNLSLFWGIWGKLRFFREFLRGNCFRIV